MDAALRTDLWNAIYGQYLKDYDTYLPIERGKFQNYLEQLYSEFFLVAMDKIPYNADDAISNIRNWHQNAKWHEIYSFVEFNAGYFDEFKPYLSSIEFSLKRNLAGYRLVGTEIIPLADENEIAAIEAAQDLGDIFRPAATHIDTALTLLSDRENPNYRNSIKESISAVEAMCKIVVGDEKTTLGRALSKLQESGVALHQSQVDAFKKLYGYTSDAGGIRHAMLEEDNLDLDDAKYMFVTCSSFVNYLKAKFPG